MANETLVASPTGIQVVSVGIQGPPGPPSLAPGAVITTQGDLIIGGGGGTPTRLPKGSDGQVLKVDATTHLLTWETLVVADISNAGTIATQNANAVAITGGSASGLTALGVTGDSTLGNSDGDLLTTRSRVRAAGTTPAVAYGTGAGTGAAGTPTGNDRVVRWTFTTGTGCAGSATVATFTFATAKPDTNYIVEVEAMDPDAKATEGIATGIYYDDASRSTTQFVIKVGSTALSDSTSYRIGLIIHEYA